MEKTKIVRCNWCEHIFPEDALYPDEEVEFCPDCNAIGYLMDLGIFGEEADETLFPHLAKAKDWEKLKQHFSVDILCDFECEIHDYEYGVGAYEPDTVDDYPTIIQWWEGLVDLENLFEVYA